MHYRAVLFDLGGVVVGSPLEAIARYEVEQGIPAGFVNRVVVTTGAAGAWSRLERGELTLDAFYPAFERDCAAAGHAIDARAMMARVAEVTVPRPAMLEAIRRIRARGLLAAAVTNNWITEGEGTGVLRPHFDAFVESAVAGVRKPDPRIYELACAELRIAPPEAVMLDDIGANLKTARASGWRPSGWAIPTRRSASSRNCSGFRCVEPWRGPPPSKDRHGNFHAVALHSAHGFPIGAHTGPSAGRWSAGDRGREPASAVGLPAAGLGPAWSSRRKKGGDPVTYSPTVICEVVPS